VRSGALAPVLTALLVRDPATRPDGAQLEQLLADAESRPSGTWGPAGPTPGAFGPPQPHPAYAGPPAGQSWPTPTVPAHASPAGGGFGPPAHHVPPTAAPRARRRAVLLAASLALAVTVAVVGVVNLLPDGGSDRDAKGGATPTNTGGDPSRGTGARPSTAATRSDTPASPSGTLLTTANARTVIESFREVSGSTTMKELTIYEDYALAEIPTRPGAKTYDEYEYRNGVARRTGPGGTIDGADEQPFDVSAMPWDGLPALMKRGDGELKVEQPTMRYVIVKGWTFNDDRPTLFFYLINEYSAVGYLATDSKGKVVASHPAS
jgi:hypothetical protein